MCFRSFLDPRSQTEFGNEIVLETLFPVFGAKQSFTGKCVPKLSLGTRTEPRYFAWVARFSEGHASAAEARPSETGS
jgi:hypothetical protein